MATKYRGKYPHRIAQTTYTRANGWHITLNNGDVHRPDSRAVVRAYPVHGLKCGMEWGDCVAAMEAANTAAARLRRYRDSRAVHVATLKTWKAALRSTTGNPRFVVLAHLGESEVRRDAVEKAIRMARQALAGLRDMRHGRAPLEV
jgi:hypothetical protein